MSTNEDKNWERPQADGVDLTPEGKQEYLASVINRLEKALAQRDEALAQVRAERDKLQWMLFRCLLQMHDGDSFKALAKWQELSERYYREAQI